MTKYSMVPYPEENNITQKHHLMSKDKSVTFWEDFDDFRIHLRGNFTHKIFW